MIFLIHFIATLTPFPDAQGVPVGASLPPADDGHQDGPLAARVGRVGLEAVVGAAAVALAGVLQKNAWRFIGKFSERLAIYFDTYVCTIFDSITLAQAPWQPSLTLKPLLYRLYWLGCTPTNGRFVDGGRGARRNEEDGDDAVPAVTEQPVRIMCKKC